MEVKKITKTDKKGKRLFIEISKEVKEITGLPKLKKGDEVLIMPKRKLDDKDMRNLIGKYIRYYDIDDEESYSLCFEGILKENKKSLWDKEEKELAKNKFVLIDPEIGAIDSFDDLNFAFDLNIIKDKEKLVNKTECKKCKKAFLQAYKYCPNCGQGNSQRWQN